MQALITSLLYIPKKASFYLVVWPNNRNYGERAGVEDSESPTCLCSNDGEGWPCTNKPCAQGTMY